MFERFTDRRAAAVVDALEEARLMRHAHIGTEHLLVALAASPRSPRSASTASAPRAEVVKTVGLGEGEHRRRPIPLHAAAKDALEVALDEAMRLGQRAASSPPTCCWPSCASATASRAAILVAAGATPSEFREARSSAA